MANLVNMSYLILLFIHFLKVNLPQGPSGYSIVIQRWRQAWNGLREHTQFDLSEINSIHVINAHLEDFYDLTGESLVKFSDHTVESAHQWLDKVIKRTNSWVKDLECDAHGEKLFRAIMTHNCYTMDAMGFRVTSSPPEVTSSLEEGGEQ